MRILSYRENGVALLALLLALWIAPAQAQLTLTGAGKGAPGGGAALSCSYTPVTTATNGSAYTGATPSASGGTPAYTFAVSGTLPTGVTINTSTGVLSGTPTQTGVFTGIQVSVTDSAAGNANCSTTFTLTVSGPITTAIFSQGGTIAGPSTAAAQYIGLWSGYTGSWNNTEGTRKTPTSIAGNFTAIRVVVSAAVASNTWTFSLRKNGAGTGLTCAITSSQTSCNTTGSISSNGTTDLFDWESCPGTVPGGGGSCSVGSAPTTITQIAISALFVPTNNGESFVAGGSVTNASTSATNYFAFTSSNTAGTSDDSAISNVMPTAGTIDNLLVSINTTPGAGNTRVITVEKNGSDQSVTCTISNPNTTCTSVGGTNTPISYAAGDTISTKWTVTGTPSASAGTNFSVRFTPITVGETVVFNTSDASNTPGTSGSRFVALNGAGDSATEALVQAATPTALHIKSLRTQISTGPNNGSSQTRIMTLRSGAVSQSVTCTLSGSNAGTDTCNDSTRSYSAAAGELVNWDWTLTGIPASVTWSKSAAVVTIP